MKKTLLSLTLLTMFFSVSFANCCSDNQNLSKNPVCEKNSIEKTQCNKCTIDDDEYCIYNQCFFDKQYRKMKSALCLTQEQENCIDNIYKNFKSDLESTHNRYRIEKNKLLGMIECDSDCYKEQEKLTKEIAKSFKEKCKDFRSEVKEQLCKNQHSAYRKFQREEKKKMKKLIKYSAVYKFPCSDCCSK